MFPKVKNTASRKIETRVLSKALFTHKDRVSIRDARIIDWEEVKPKGWINSTKIGAIKLIIKFLVLLLIALTLIYYSFINIAIFNMLHMTLRIDHKALKNPLVIKSP